ncbi:unnamed protein product, partial [Discosporangium mesarthrocarpum]
MVLLRPDPKVEVPESSFTIPCQEGTTLKVSGKQVEAIVSGLRGLSSLPCSMPDKGLFLTRDGRGFVRCYSGVQEGTLFPLAEGLLFLKPGVFLPRACITQVTCGRGGSAQTRYVDLI